MLKEVAINYAVNIINFAIRNFSFFVVIPWLSSAGNEFAIYATISTISVVVGYLDFGFLRAAQVFSAAQYKEKNLLKEAEYIFAGGIAYTLIVLLLSVILSLASFYPEYIINSPHKGDLVLASSMLKLAGLNICLLAVQRALNIFLDNRLKLYVYNIALSAVNIFSTVVAVILHLNFSEFPVLEYYISLVVGNLLLTCILLYVVFSIKEFEFSDLIDASVLRERIKAMYALAGNNLFASISWLFFIELDSVYVSRFIGIDAMFVFAPLVTIFGIQKFGTGMLWGPVNTIIMRNKGELRLDEDNVQYLLLINFFLVTLGSVTLSMYSEPFILGWIGKDYSESVRLLKFGALYLALSPISMLFVSTYSSKERVAGLYKYSFLQVFSFWTIWLISVEVSAQKSMVVFVLIKLFSFFLSDVYCFVKIFRYLCYPGLGLKIVKILSLGIPVIYVLYLINNSLNSNSELFVTLLSMVVGLSLPLVIISWPRISLIMNKNYGK